MIDLNIVTHKGDFKLFINRIKAVYVSDYNVRRSLITALDGFFTREKDSEFATETNLTNKIYSDGKVLNINDYEYFKVTDHFDLKNELKLGAKTILLKYIEKKTEKIEYMESFQTMKYIIEEIALTIQDAILEDITSLTLDINFDFEKKQLLKLILVDIIKEEYLANYMDISYEELIELQLELLLAITKESSKPSIIAIDVPFFNDKWMDFFNMFSQNVYIILLCDKIPNKISSKDVFLFVDNLKIDLYDDNALYDLCMNENRNYTLDEYRTFLIKKYRL